MPVYICPKCGRQFGQKSHYDAHMNKKNPCDANINLREIVDTAVQQVVGALQIEARPGTNVGLARNTMSGIVRSREEATRLFVNIHNLLWNEAGFTPEKALDHMILFIAYRMIEPQIDILSLPRECRWSYLVNLPDEHALDEGIRAGITSFRRNDTTRAFFKPHTIRSADIIRRLVAEINRLDVDYLREKDILGDVFEYMVGRGMSTMSDEGQYFTDRAICRLGRILSLEVREGRIFREDGSLCTFCDPFCGTGGFVTEFVKGVAGELVRLGKPIDWSVMKSSVYAQDKSESAAKNTLLNQLIITGELFDAKNIREGNSYQDPLVIGSTAPFSGTSFDYIMMNPPYGGDKSKGKEFKFRYYRETKGPDGKKVKVYKVNPEIQSIGIEDHDKVSAGVQLAMATLSEDGGVCSIVLPEGFFFGATKKSVDLRKKLAEEYCVHYIVDIPKGAFINTKGTSTAMMVFQRGMGSTKEIKFINLEREPLASATLEDLRGKNYSFNYKQYVPQDACEIEGFEMVRLGDICNVRSGYAFKSNMFTKNSTDMKVVKIKNIVNNKIVFDDNNDRFMYSPSLEKYLIKHNDFVIAMTGATTGKVAISKSTEQFLLNQRVGMFTNFKDNVNPLYVYYYIHNKDSWFKNQSSGTARENISPSQILNLQIPLPSLERQKEIVRAIEVWEDFAHREEEMVKMLEEQMMFEVREMGRGKKRVRLGDVLVKVPGKKHAVKEGTDSGKYPLVRSSKDGKVKWMDTYDYEGPHIVVGTGGIANVGLFERFNVSTEMLVFDSSSGSLLGFVYYWVKHNIELVNELCFQGTTLKHLNRDAFFNIEIPLPPLTEQQRLQSDFEEIRHKHTKIAEYRAKAQEAIQRLIPGAGSTTDSPSTEEVVLTSGSVASVDSELKNVRTVVSTPASEQPVTPTDTASVPDFTKMKIGELKKYARDHKIKGFSTKNKAGLIELLVAHSHSSSL